MSEVVQQVAFKPIPEGTPLQGVIKLYDEWTTYEHEVLSDNYIGPFETARLTATYFPEDTRSSVKLLDIGAGTGLVGIEVRKRGFTHIDALEPSLGMLKNAQDREIYANYFTEYLTTETPCSMHTDSYDCVMSSGSIGGVHIPVGVLGDLVRILKPGGLIIIAVRDSGQNLDLIDVASELEEEGKITVLRSERIPHLHNGYKGVMYVYRKVQPSILSS